MGEGWGGALPIQQRQPDRELRAYTVVALSLYSTFMVGHNLLHISQSQAESFDVMTVASRYAVEFLKNLFQVLFFDSNAVVLNGDIQVFGVVTG